MRLFAWTRGLKWMAIAFVFVIATPAFSGNLNTSALSARDWKKIEIPGAKCGDGLPYKIFFDAKNTKKLGIEFMGGGACWNASTCWGPNFRTWIHPVPHPIPNELMSQDSSKSPLSERTMIYFPYCTGDIYGGDHVGDYSFGKISHTGYSNVQRALRYLDEKGYVDFQDLTHVTLFGASAGALGSLIHAKTIESYLSKDVKKSIVADSPGLHWGENFWDKFTPAIIRDFSRNLAPVGVEVIMGEGLLAPQLERVCDRLSKWKVGILQSTEDIIMARVFGHISTKEHARLVLGQEGVKEIVKTISNCSAWIPDTKMHTFLLLPQSARMESDGKSALDYAREIIESAE